MAKQTDDYEPKLTAAEMVKVAWLAARMAKRGLADDRTYGGRIDQSDLERKVDRILDGARAREEQAAKKK